MHSSFDLRLDAFKRELWWELESRFYGVIVAAVAVLSIGYIIWSWKDGRPR
jgi:hypothetical protein